MGAPEDLLSSLGIARAEGAPWLLLAAHPDDEVLGASWLLSCARPIFVVHLTDGAPRSAELRGDHASITRDAYAAMREVEARRALALAGIAGAHPLGGVDQEAHEAIAELAPRFRALLAELKPAAVVTHPYEGGHPDHDTAAFIAATGTCPIVEMTSYHLSQGALRTGAFLPGPLEVQHVLSAEERAKKEAMLACHASQARLLSMFPLDAERFRRAPRYDFGAPPHEGTLFYESMGWLDGERWREHARRARWR